MLAFNTQRVPPTNTTVLFAEYFEVCRQFSETSAARETHQLFMAQICSLRELLRHQTYRGTSSTSAMGNATGGLVSRASRRSATLSQDVVSLGDGHYTGKAYGLSPGEDDVGGNSELRAGDPANSIPPLPLSNLGATQQNSSAASINDDHSSLYPRTSSQHATPRSSNVYPAKRGGYDSPRGRLKSIGMTTAMGNEVAATKVASAFTILRSDCGYEYYHEKYYKTWNAFTDQLANTLVDVVTAWVTDNEVYGNMTGKLVRLSSSCCYDATHGMCLLRWNSFKEVRNYIDSLHAVLNAPLSVFCTPLAIGFDVLGVPVLCLSLAPVSAPWQNWDLVYPVWHAFGGLCASLHLLKPLDRAEGARHDMGRFSGFAGPSGLRTGAASGVVGISAAGILGGNGVGDGLGGDPLESFGTSANTSAAFSPLFSGNPHTTQRKSVFYAASEAMQGMPLMNLAFPAMDGVREDTRLPTLLVANGADARWYFLDARALSAYQLFSRHTPSGARVPRREMYTTPGGCVLKDCGPNELILQSKLKIMVDQMLRGVSWNASILVSTLAHAHGVRYGPYIYAVLDLLRSEERHLQQKAGANGRRVTNIPNSQSPQQCGRCITAVVGELLARVIKHVVRREWYNVTRGADSTWLIRFQRYCTASFVPRRDREGGSSANVSVNPNDKYDEEERERLELGEPFIEVLLRIIEGVFLVQDADSAGAGTSSQVNGTGNAEGGTNASTAPPTPATSPTGTAPTSVFTPPVEASAGRAGGWGGTSYPAFNAAFRRVNFRADVFEELLFAVNDQYVFRAYVAEEKSIEWQVLSRRRQPHLDRYSRHQRGSAGLNGPIGGARRTAAGRSVSADAGRATFSGRGATGGTFGGGATVAQGKGFDRTGGGAGAAAGQGAGAATGLGGRYPVVLEEDRINERASDWLAAWALQCLQEMLGVSFVLRGNRIDVDRGADSAHLFRNFFSLSGAEACPLRTQPYTSTLDIPLCLTLGGKEKVLDYAREQRQIGLRVQSVPLRWGTSTVPAMKADHFARMGQFLQLHAADVRIACRGWVVAEDFDFLDPNNNLLTSARGGIGTGLGNRGEGGAASRVRGYGATDIDLGAHAAARESAANDNRLRYAFRASVAWRACWLNGKTDLGEALNAWYDFTRYTKTIMESSVGVGLILRARVLLLANIATHFVTPRITTMLETLRVELDLLTGGMLAIARDTSFSGVTNAPGGPYGTPSPPPAGASGMASSGAGGNSVARPARAASSVLPPREAEDGAYGMVGTQVFTAAISYNAAAAATALRSEDLPLYDSSARLPARGMMAKSFDLRPIQCVELYMTLLRILIRHTLAAQQQRSPEENLESAITLCALRRELIERSCGERSIEAAIAANDVGLLLLKNSRTFPQAKQEFLRAASVLRLHLPSLPPLPDDDDDMMEDMEEDMVPGESMDGRGSFGGGGGGGGSPLPPQSSPTPVSSRAQSPRPPPCILPRAASPLVGVNGSGAGGVPRLGATGNSQLPRTSMPSRIVNDCMRSQLLPMPERVDSALYGVLNNLAYLYCCQAQHLFNRFIVSTERWIDQARRKKALTKVTTGEQLFRRRMVFGDRVDALLARATETLQQVLAHESSVSVYDYAVALNNQASVLFFHYQFGEARRLLQYSLAITARLVSCTAQDVGPSALLLEPCIESGAATSRLVLLPGSYSCVGEASADAAAVGYASSGFPRDQQVLEAASITARGMEEIMGGVPSWTMSSVSALSDVANQVTVCRANALFLLRQIDSELSFICLLRVKRVAANYFSLWRVRREQRRDEAFGMLKRVVAGALTRVYIARRYRFSAYHFWMRQPAVFTRKMDPNFVRLTRRQRADVWYEQVEGATRLLMRVMRGAKVRIEVGRTHSFTQQYLRSRYAVEASIWGRMAQVYEVCMLHWLVGYGVLYLKENKDSVEQWRADDLDILKKCEAKEREERTTIALREVVDHEKVMRQHVTGLQWVQRERLRVLHVTNHAAIVVRAPQPPLVPAPPLIVPAAGGAAAPASEYTRGSQAATPSLVHDTSSTSNSSFAPPVTSPPTGAELHPPTPATIAMTSVLTGPRDASLVPSPPSSGLSGLLSRPPLPFATVDRSEDGGLTTGVTTPALSTPTAAGKPITTSSPTALNVSGYNAVSLVSPVSPSSQEVQPSRRRTRQVRIAESSSMRSDSRLHSDEEFRRQERKYREEERTVNQAVKRQQQLLQASHQHSSGPDSSDVMDAANDSSDPSHLPPAEEASGASLGSGTAASSSSCQQHSGPSGQSLTPSRLSPPLPPSVGAGATVVVAPSHSIPSPSPSQPSPMSFTPVSGETTPVPVEEKGGGSGGGVDNMRATGSAVAAGLSRERKEAVQSDSTPNPGARVLQGDLLYSFLVTRRALPLYVETSLALHREYGDFLIGLMRPPLVAQARQLRKLSQLDEDERAGRRSLLRLEASEFVFLMASALRQHHRLFNAGLVERHGQYVRELAGQFRSSLTAESRGHIAQNTSSGGVPQRPATASGITSKEAATGHPSTATPPFPFRLDMNSALFQRAKSLLGDLPNAATMLATLSDASAASALLQLTQNEPASTPFTATTTTAAATAPTDSSSAAEARGKGAEARPTTASNDGSYLTCSANSSPPLQEHAVAPLKPTAPGVPHAPPAGPQQTPPSQWAAPVTSSGKPAMNQRHHDMADMDALTSLATTTTTAAATPVTASVKSEETRLNAPPYEGMPPTPAREIVSSDHSHRAQPLNPPVPSAFTPYAEGGRPASAVSRAPFVPPVVAVSSSPSLVDSVGGQPTPSQKTPSVNSSFVSTQRAALLPQPQAPSQTQATPDQPYAATRTVSSGTVVGAAPSSSVGTSNGTHIVDSAFNHSNTSGTTRHPKQPTMTLTTTAEPTTNGTNRKHRSKAEQFVPPDPLLQALNGMAGVSISPTNGDTGGAARSSSTAEDGHRHRHRHRHHHRTEV